MSLLIIFNTFDPNRDSNCVSPDLLDWIRICVVTYELLARMVEDNCSGTLKSPNGSIQKQDSGVREAFVPLDWTMSVLTPA